MNSNQPTPDQSAPEAVTGAARLVLAGIGLIGLLGDALLDFLQKRAAEASSTIAARPPQIIREMSRPAENAMNDQFNRLGLITHADLQALLNQVTDLETQIDRIAARRQSKE